MREATADAHRRLDAAFGSLALDERGGLRRFLSAHGIGLMSVFRTYRSFIESVLGLRCPDYPSMLRADLGALGVPPSDMPELPPAPAVAEHSAATGVAYVVTGSRLGLRMIRERGYWGEAAGFRSRYMEDTQGTAIWKELAGLLRKTRPDPSDRAAAEAAALSTFDTYARAFAVSADNNRDVARADG